MEKPVKTALPIAPMKQRPSGFLNPEYTPDDVFDYVRELHEVLWRFVRAEYPNANGDLCLWIPPALTTAEHRRVNLKE
jgi:hypothetical protein